MTPEQFQALSDRWEAIERQLNQHDADDRRAMGDHLKHAEKLQIEIERAMDEAPYEFDEDGNVVLIVKGANDHG